MSHSFENPGMQFRELAKSTRNEGIALQRAAASLQEFSFVSLVQSLCPDSPVINQRGLEAAHELHRAATNMCNGRGLGHWVPFAALCRDLTLANATQAITDTVHPVLGPGSVAVNSVLGAGATILTGLTGGRSLGIPLVETPPDVTSVGVWTLDGESTAQREPVFAQRVLEQKTVSVQVIVTRRLLLQSSIDVDRELRATLSTHLFSAIDQAIINGDGVAQPLGLLRDPDLDVLSAGTNGAAPAWSHVVELEHAVAARAGVAASPAWVLHPALRKKLRTTARGSGLDYIMTGDDLLQRPTHVSTSAPVNLTKGTGTGLTALVYGDLAELVVGFWGPAAVDVLVDGVTMRKEGKVRIVGRVDVGFVARNIKAFSAYQDLNPA